MAQSMELSTDFGSLRRYQNSPNFWLAVLSGSLAVHLVFLLSGQWLLVRVAPVKSGGVPTPIEFVDLPSSSQSTQVNRQTAPKVLTVPAPADPTPIQAAKPTEPTVESSPPPQPISEQPVRSPSIPEPSIPEPSTPEQPVPEQPKNNLRPQPAPSSTAPRPTAPAPKPSAPPEPKPGSSSSPEETGTALPGDPLPNPAIPGDSDPQPGSPSGGPNPVAPNPSLPSVPITDQRGEGTGIEVALSNSQLGDTGRTIPDRAARPIELSKPFPSLTYPPAIALNLGQSVRLTVLVKKTGKPDLVMVKEGSRSLEYDQFAIELIKQWQFEPALQAGEPVDSLLDISVQLSPLK